MAQLIYRAPKAGAKFRLAMLRLLDERTGHDFTDHHQLFGSVVPNCESLHTMKLMQKWALDTLLSHRNKIFLSVLI